MPACHAPVGKRLEPCQPDGAQQSPFGNKVTGMTISRPDRFALLSLTYTLLLYGGSGWARNLQLMLMDVLGKWYSWMPILGCVILLLFPLWQLGKKVRSNGVVTNALLAMVVSGYAAALFSLPIPAEKIHLVQYGILAWLVTEALTDRLYGFSLHLTAFVVVMIIGVGDEFVQWLRPNRVGDINDIGLNTLAAFLAQILLYTLQREPVGKQVKHTVPLPRENCKAKAGGRRSPIPPI